jgi:hypothetical protein
MNSLKSHFVFTQVSSPVCLVKGCLIHVFYLYTATIRVVGNLCHLSSFGYLTGSRQCLFSSYLHTTIIRIVGNPCHLSSYGYLTDSRQCLLSSYLHTTIIRVVGNTCHLSSYIYHTDRQPFSPVKLHFPSRVGSLSSTI